MRIRRWFLRPRYTLIEPGQNPLDDDALMQSSKRARRLSLTRVFVVVWVMALLGTGLWAWAGPQIAPTVQVNAQSPTPGGAAALPTLVPTGEVAATIIPSATPTPTPTITPTPTEFLDSFWNESYPTPGGIVYETPKP